METLWLGSPRKWLLNERCRCLKFNCSKTMQPQKNRLV